MKTLTAVAVAAFLLASCGQKVPQPPEATGSASVSVSLPTAKPAYTKHVVATAALERFADCTAVTKSLRADALRYVGPYGLGGYGGSVAIAGRMAATGETTSGAAAAAPVAEDKSVGVDYSTTNVQEEGVDEPDTIETDGERIFAVANGVLHAAVMQNGRPSLVGALRLQSSDAQLMLEGKRLIVVGNDQVTPGEVRPMQRGLAMSMPVAYAEKTLVQILDVSEPRAMRIESTLHLDGSYVSARAVGGIARIVIRRSSPDISFATPNDGAAATIERAVAFNKTVVSKATVDKWLPRYKLQKGSSTKTGLVSSCGTTYHPPVFSGLSTVTVVSVDPTNPTPRNGSTVVGGGEMVYASHDNLYVTAVKWPAPQPYATNVKGAPGSESGSSGSAGAVTVPDVAVASPITEETQIHKFSITGPSASYLASGIVKGTLLNQFAMSEFEGNLRVATTRNIVSPTQQTSSSGVTVFTGRAKALVPVGSVGGLGKGEQIRAVRFLGPVGYLVTFRQTDPLFTIDLHNPLAPKVAGELKMPGFSAYLHPVGDGLILGIGEVAKADGTVHDEQGRWYGTKVSLFDVRDVAHPKEIAQHVISGAQSLVENEHHAFLWWAPRKLALVPEMTYTQDGFRGVVGMHVDQTISEAGRIAAPQPPNSQSPDYYYGGPGIERVIVVGDSIVTLSQTGLGANDISSFAQRAFVAF